MANGYHPTRTSCYNVPDDVIAKSLSKDDYYFAKIWAENKLRSDVTAPPRRLKSCAKRLSRRVVPGRRTRSIRMTPHTGAGVEKLRGLFTTDERRTRVSRGVRVEKPGEFFNSWGCLALGTRDGSLCRSAAYRVY